MEWLTSHEKVILISRRLGGSALSQVMEKFPEKIALAVFVTALTPGPELNVSTPVVFCKYSKKTSRGVAKRILRSGSFLDCCDKPLSYFASIVYWKTTTRSRQPLHLRRLNPPTTFGSGPISCHRKFVSSAQLR
ncbi:hypothetical protein ACJRO7_034762 [Eucalyptus globulus]|uniref:Uncharacterized protein n=1 Tax=Eucalyptus globulus TaxID=34317 RepID=A0ABD3J7N9_EUCGL